MIFFRVFLYFICIISIGWSVLVFGGPPIIKRLISSYTDGVLTPSGITVSPTFDINISRIDLIYRDEIGGRQIEGFSRATKIAWSLFDDKPFLEINLGPTVIKDHAIADGIIIYTPSFREIDWQSVAIASDIDELSWGQYTQTRSLTLTLNLNLETAKMSNIGIKAETLQASAGQSNFSASLITGNLGEQSLNTFFNGQSLSGTFSVEDIMVSELDIAAPEAKIDIAFTEDKKNLKIYSHDVKLSKSGGLINLKLMEILINSMSYKNYM